MFRLAVVVLSLAAACGGPRGPSGRAAEGVKVYLAALKSNDPRDAYNMLSDITRRRVSFEQFSREWKASAKERAWQVDALEKGLAGNPDVGEHALVSYSDGKLVNLEREGELWKLESELVSRSRAKRPRDAIRLFADAVQQRDVSGMLGILTTRRREGIAKQVEGFVAGIGKHVNGPLEELTDRAELRWDEGGIQYRIVMKKEDDEWRIDDIYIRPKPKDDEGTTDTEDSDDP